MVLIFISMKMLHVSFTSCHVGPNISDKRGFVVPRKEQKVGEKILHDSSIKINSINI